MGKREKMSNKKGLIYLHSAEREVGYSEQKKTEEKTYRRNNLAKITVEEKMLK